jgi:phosphate starvation-inducible protein PhoH and related proteins
VVKLGQKDIVRHKLVTRIVNAYDKYDKERAEAREAQKAEKDNSK